MLEIWPFHRMVRHPLATATRASSPLPFCINHTPWCSKKILMTGLLRAPPCNLWMSNGFSPNRNWCYPATTTQCFETSYTTWQSWNTWWEAHVLTSNTCGTLDILYPCILKSPKHHWLTNVYTCCDTHTMMPGTSSRLAMSGLLGKNYQSACCTPLSPSSGTKVSFSIPNTAPYLHSNHIRQIFLVKLLQEPPQNLQPHFYTRCENIKDSLSCHSNQQAQLSQTRRDTSNGMSWPRK